MNKILFITSYELNDFNAAKERVAAYVNCISKHAEISLLYPGKSKAVKKKNNVNYLQIKHLRKNNSLISKFLSELIFLTKVICYLKFTKKKFDTLIISIPSMFLLISLSFFKCKKILDVRDITWDYLSSNILKFILKKLFIFYINKCDLVLCTNNSQKKYFERNLILKNIKIISNGISLERYNNLKFLESSYNEEELILYTGNIGRAQKLFTLIECAKRLRRFKFVIIGNGSDFSYLKNKIYQEKILNVSLCEAMNWEQLKEYYLKCKILYAQILKSYDTAIPSKIYEYAALNKQIIFACDGTGKEIGNFLNNFNIIEPDNVFVLEKTILNLMAQKNKILSNDKIIKKNFIREFEIEKKINYIFNES